MFAIKIDLHTKQASEYTLYLAKACFSQEIKDQKTQDVL